MLLSIPNLVALEPELFSNTEFKPNGGVLDFFQFKNELYVAGNDGIHGIELMKISTSQEKLSLFVDINTSGDSNPFIIADLGDKFIFTTKNNITSPTKFWSSDGTESGTEYLFEVDSCYTPSKLRSNSIVRENLLYVSLPNSVHGEDLWEIDGTSEGCKNLSAINNYYFYKYKELVGNTLVIIGNSLENSSNDYIWFSNKKGLLEKFGEFRLNKGLHPEYKYWYNLKDNNFFYYVKNPNEDKLKLSILDADNKKNIALFSSDSSYIKNFKKENFYALKNKAFFVTYKGYFIDGLWVSDIKNNKIIDLSEAGIDTKSIKEVYFMNEVGNRLFFQIYYRDNITKLYSSDGTVNGTSELGVNSYYYIPSNNNIVHNGYIYYLSDNNENKVGLWRSNGTLEDTQEIIKIPTSNEKGYYFNTSILNQTSNDDILFTTSHEDEAVLYSLNTNTNQLKNIYSSNNRKIISYTTQINDFLFIPYFGKDESFILINKNDFTEELKPVDKTSNDPYLYFHLYHYNKYIYFFADYYNNGHYKLYRIYSPSSNNTKVNSVKNQGIVIYPNPTNNNLTLELEEMTDISIVDINGNLVLSFNNFTGGTIDVSSLTTGYYSITNNNGKLLGKFIKAD
jgi:hypothetical protein